MVIKTDNTRNLPRIALCGKLRSGKTAAAEHLENTQGLTRLSFGSALKRFADDLFFFSEVYKSDYMANGAVSKKPRKLYQDFGQAMRALDSNIWIDYVASSIEYNNNLLSTKGYVIDDLRQPNEYQWAKDNGFVIVRVVADDKTRIKRAADAGDVYKSEDLSHDTESHSDGFKVDYELSNDGSYGELMVGIGDIYQSVMRKEEGNVID